MWRSSFVIEEQFTRNPLGPGKLDILDISGIVRIRTRLAVDLGPSSFGREYCTLFLLSHVKLRSSDSDNTTYIKLSNLIHVVA